MFQNKMLDFSKSRTAIYLIFSLIVVIAKYIWCCVQFMLLKPHCISLHIFIGINEFESICWHLILYVSAFSFPVNIYNFGCLKRIRFKINRLTFKMIKEKSFSSIIFSIFINGGNFINDTTDTQPIW